MIRYSAKPRDFFKLSALALKLCGNGPGIEIGAAAHNRFDLPGARNAAPYSGEEQADFDFYAREQEKLVGAHALIDIITDEHLLPGVTDSSQDYVLSSHVVEHLPDVISAFVEWNRVVRDGGIVFMIVPQRDALPEDRERPITPLREFWVDYRKKYTAATHPLEEVPQGRRGHYHVFMLDSMRELIESCVKKGLFAWEIIATEDPDTKVGNGFTVACRVSKAAPLEIFKEAKPELPAEVVLLAADLVDLSIAAPTAVI